MHVWLPFTRHNQVQVRVRWRPLWDWKVELPVSVHEYPEGWLEVYATGRVVVGLRALPIEVFVPCGVVNGRFRWGVPAARREELSMGLKRITQEAGSPSVGGPGPADGAAFPTLLQYMTLTTFEDGSPRKTASVIVVCDGGGWRGCVSDKANSRTLWRTSPTVEGLFLELEQALVVDDPGSWRRSEGESGNRRKRS